MARPERRFCRRIVPAQGFSTDLGKARVMLMSEVIFSGAGRPVGFWRDEDNGLEAHPPSSAARTMSKVTVFIDLNGISQAAFLRVLFGSLPADRAPSVVPPRTKRAPWLIGFRRALGGLCARLLPLLERITGGCSGNNLKGRSISADHIEGFVLEGENPMTVVGKQGVGMPGMD